MKKVIILFAIIIVVISIGGYYIYNNFIKNNCLKNDESCYRDAVKFCKVGVKQESETDIGYAKMEWQHEILGVENGLCKVRRLANNKVNIGKETAEETKTFYLYYELGNPDKIIKSEDVK